VRNNKGNNDIRSEPQEFYFREIHCVHIITLYSSYILLKHRVRLHFTVFSIINSRHLLDFHVIFFIRVYAV